tara:strand:- start:465 stop:911 length:447 start_codon:yes stop_codon:yes gene_type:complete
MTKYILIIVLLLVSNCQTTEQTIQSQANPFIENKRSSVQVTKQSSVKQSKAIQKTSKRISLPKVYTLKLKNFDRETIKRTRNYLSNVKYLEEIKLIKSSEMQYIYSVLGNIELGDLEDQVIKALAKSGFKIKNLYIKSFSSEISVEIL